MTTHKLVLAGFGGQGVMLIGQMIAYAGMLEGKEVTWMPSYGPEMRGGTANCTVIVSDKKISSPIVTEATAVVVMNLPSLLKFEPLVKSGGQLFVNTSLVKENPFRDDIEIYNIDASKIARSLHHDKVSNMVVLGAIVNKTNVVKMESVEKVMEKLFTGRKAQLLPFSKKALTAWRTEIDFDFSYADIVFKNGKVITVNQEDKIEEAVGIKGNKIVFVGSNEEGEQIIDDTTKIIDLDGKTLCPGFIDTHYHPILNGFFGDDEDATIINTDYSNCKSLKDILNLIKKAAKKRPAGQWISMMGYDQNRIEEKRHITIEELDEAAPNHPVQCMRTCGHVCIYNSKALEKIGIFQPDDASKYPKDEIVVEHGKLTGMVKDHTHFYLWSKVIYTEEEQIAAAMKSNQLLLENGITSVHDAGECGAPSYKIMQRLCRERKFKPREYMMLHSIFGKPISLEENHHFLALGLESGLGDEHFKIGACKFMIDGGTSGPSCATREPYSHDPNLPGILGWSREETADYIKLIHDSGCQATAHAVGDLAIEFMVEGYEKAFETNPRSSARHRIEHCAIVDQDLIERMAKLNICPSCNPGFITWNGRNYTKFYGERMAYFIALRSMVNAGIMVSISSDAPSGPINSMSVLDGCVNRCDRITNEPVDQTQAITLPEAIRLYTYNGAYASYEESIKGSIEVGKLADLVVLSEDILAVSKNKISDVKVELTMIDGKIEYSLNNMRNT